MASMTSGPPPVKEGLGTTANDDNTISELIAVSKHLVGKLIGKAGTTIQSLQQDTATNIQIDQVSSSWESHMSAWHDSSTAALASSAAVAVQLCMRIVSCLVSSELDVWWFVSQRCTVVSCALLGMGQHWLKGKCTVQCM
jgi:hypothetical protein